MARLLNANDVAEQALRKIGAFAINDSAADKDELDLALLWLDLNMAELSNRKLWWLVPQAITVDLTSGTGNYLLSDILEEKAPDGFAFPVEVLLVRNGRDLPVEIIPRRTWDAYEDKTTAGPPTEVHFDRQRETRINLYPVPNETGLQLKITFQTFPPTVATPDENDHGLRLAWQRWAIYRVAADIGDGTVRLLTNDQLSAFESKAVRAETALMAVDNRERTSAPPQVARVDY